MNQFKQSAHESKLNQLLTDQLISIKNVDYERLPRLVSKQMPGDTRY